MRFSSCFIVLRLPLLLSNGSSSSCHYLLLSCLLILQPCQLLHHHHLLLLLILLPFFLLFLLLPPLFVLRFLPFFSPLFILHHLLLHSLLFVPRLLPPPPPPGLKTRACSPIRRASPSGPWCWVTSRGRGPRQPTGWDRSVAMETVSPAQTASSSMLCDSAQACRSYEDDLVFKYRFRGLTFNSTCRPCDKLFLLGTTPQHLKANYHWMKCCSCIFHLKFSHS